MLSPEAARWSAEAAERIGCTGLSRWLDLFSQWLGLPAGAVPPATSQRFATVAEPSRGFVLTLHDPQWANPAAADPDKWVFYNAEIDAGLAPLPFGLDVGAETPASARAKLPGEAFGGRKADLERGNRAITHYLPDNRVVVVDFMAEMRGISAVTLARLYDWPTFRE